MATVRRNLNELSPEALRAELAPLKLPDKLKGACVRFLIDSEAFTYLLDNESL